MFIWSAEHRKLEKERNEEETEGKVEGQKGRIRGGGGKEEKIRAVGRKELSRGVSTNQSQAYIPLFLTKQGPMWDYLCLCTVSFHPLP